VVVVGAGAAELGVWVPAELAGAGAVVGVVGAGPAGRVVVVVGGCVVSGVGGAVVVVVRHYFRQRS